MGVTQRRIDRLTHKAYRLSHRTGGSWTLLRLSWKALGRALGQLLGVLRPLQGTLERVLGGLVQLLACKGQNMKNRALAASETKILFCRKATEWPLKGSNAAVGR